MREKANRCPEGAPPPRLTTTAVWSGGRPEIPGEAEIGNAKFDLTDLSVHAGRDGRWDSREVWSSFKAVQKSDPPSRDQIQTFLEGERQNKQIPPRKRNRMPHACVMVERKSD